jgi:hypothetical protein
MIVAAMPVFGRSTAVVAARNKGGDCKDHHCGADADRAQPTRWLSARFHDVDIVDTVEPHHKGAADDWEAVALPGQARASVAA